MRTLYIFGNGFDIAHGIRTPYSAFRSFLKNKHEVFLSRFEAVYHIQPLDDTEPWYTEEAQKRWDNRVLEKLWKCFEENIGKPDADGMYDYAVSLVDSMPEKGVKRTLDYHWKREYGFSAELQKYVLEWLKTVDTSAACCKKESLINANSDYFLTFNYTDTLERVYGITDVLHIHGGIPSCSKTPPIMGHGNQYIIDYYTRRAEQAKKESIEWSQSINEAIVKYCKSLYKDTDAIIARNEEFFTRIRDVDQVICLGVSFGDVDIPYLERIRQVAKPTTRWLVYYYGDDAYRDLKSIFGVLGIRRKYETYLLPSDHFWDR